MPPRAQALARAAGGASARVLPPLVCLLALVLVWQLLTMGEASTLPSPTRVLDESWELVTNPFYDRGGLD